ncbi:MAG TPA: alkaline phosphatase family protein [Anaerolineae bacterium]|nr:alkaline phosphatase family protein [Anaerolineae bacterium]
MQKRSIWLIVTIFFVGLILLSGCQTSIQTPSPPLRSPTETIHPTQTLPTETFVPTTIPTQIAAIPTETRQVPERSVFLISWDAARADFIYKLMEDGTLPTFASVLKRGVRAEYAQTIDPSLTAAAHNSMSSGSSPSHTGIVSNAFHLPKDDFYWYRNGFDEVMDNAEPIWVTASKAGLTTAAVFFVGGSPKHEGQLADYTIGYGIRDAYSEQRHVDLEKAEDWETTPQTYSPALSGSFSIKDVGRVYLLVLDSTDDATENYDSVLLNTEKKSDQAINLKQNEWGSMVLLKRSYAGADFLIQEITSKEVTLFHSNVYHNNIAPSDLRDVINQRFGFFPAGPDPYAMGDGWITEDDFIHMLERQSTYMAEVAAWVYDTYHPDLLMTWQDNFDAAGHAFLMVDERQMDYSSEKAAQYADYYRQAGAIADKSLSLMLEAIDLDKTTLIIGGDHGMAPIHSVVYVNTILEQAGLLTLDAQSHVVINKTKAFAVASGGAVHIYINLIGREKEGTVTPEEYPQIQQQIIDLFTNLKDPQTGDPVFERVLPHDQLAPLGLDHPNSGDVFAQANFGYHLNGWRGKNFIFEQADFYGQHGYDSALPEMHTIFIAAGAGIPESGEPIPPVHIIDYAPTIASWLGFQPAPTVDGQPIPSLTQP